jgi:hypothetical protein
MNNAVKEQNRVSRNKTMHLNLTVLWLGSQGTQWRKDHLFNKLEKLNIDLQKKKK